MMTKFLKNWKLTSVARVLIKEQTFAKGQWNFTNPREEWEVAVKSCNYTVNHQSK